MVVVGQAGAIDSGSIWFLLGTIGMALGAAYVIGTGRNEENTTMKRFYTITAIVAVIGTIAYGIMTLGFGRITVTDGGKPHMVYWVHYIGWLLITPLILYELALVAEATRRTIAALVGFDGAMVVFGLAAALGGTGMSVGGLDTETFHLVLWGVSVVAYLCVFGLLVRSLSREAAQQSPEVAMLFSMLRNVVIVLWTLYPVVWLLGPSVLDLLSTSITWPVFLVIDLLVVVGFGVLLLRSDAVLEQTAGSLARSTAD